MEGLIFGILWYINYLMIIIIDDMQIVTFLFCIPTI